jgi:hypothetical protein
MARPRLGDSESKRLQMVITEDELEAIDEWQHANRIASRSEAIRRLVQIALRADETVDALFTQAGTALSRFNKTTDRFEVAAKDEQGAFTPATVAAAEVIAEVSEDLLFLTLELKALNNQLSPYRTFPVLADATAKADSAAAKARAFISKLKKSGADGK